MATRVAINGFGRIGRLVARALLQKQDSGLELVSINDLADAESNALLFKRDSVHGAYAGEVRADGNDLIIDGRRIKVTAERDPGKLPHGDNGIDIALECTGFFTDRDKAGAHLTAGAKKVLISAPGKGVDLTVVYGVNHDKLTAEHKIVSNASCTTNCLAPLAKVLNDTVGIERGLMTTIHAYTNDQKILDQIHSDKRRARGGGHVDDPDHHRRRPRGGRGAAGAEGQARRIGHPRSDAECQRRRSHLHAEARHQPRGSERRPPRSGGERPSERHPRL
jgi:glyceraldehyde 3-phosphate dehydrogenase